MEEGSYPDSDEPIVFVQITTIRSDAVHTRTFSSEILIIQVDRGVLVTSLS
jgi:hypothetical protein